MNNEYIPYGPEWEKEMTKLPKNMLIQMLRKAHQRRKDLEDALEELMCWQNGVPLPTYTKGWTAAMERAEALLSSAPRHKGVTQQTVPVAIQPTKKGRNAE